MSSRAHRAPRNPRIALLSALACAALTACGGGGGGGTTDTTDAAAAAAEREARAFASPGYLVPAGQTSLSIALSSCDYRVEDAQGNVSVTSVGDGTLTLQADGTVVVTGRTTAQGNNSELARLPMGNVERAFLAMGINDRVTNPSLTSAEYEFDVSSSQLGLRIEALSRSDGTGQVTVSLPNGNEHTCQVPANAFSLPETISAQRLARIASNATRVDGTNLGVNADLDSDSQNVTWFNGVSGHRYNDITNPAYQGARLVRVARVDQPGTPAGSFSVSSDGASFTPVSVTRLPGSAPSFIRYNESYTAQTRNGVPELDVQTERTYASGNTPSHVIRLFREGDALLPSPQLLMTVPTYYSGALGQASALPNSYFAVNTRIPLSNCQNAQGQAIQRQIMFSEEGRIYWLDGNSQVLRTLTPSDAEHQRRELSQNADGLEADFKTYTDALNAAQDMANQQLTISRITGLISWQQNGTSSLTETCSAPSQRSNRNAITQGRVQSMAVNTTGTTNTSSYTCAGDSGPTSWQHAVDSNGLFSTTTTLPGGNPTTVNWSGGNSWFTEVGANYTERYATTPTSNPAVSANVTLAHPATTVRQGCFTQPLFRLNGATVEFINPLSP